MAVLGLLERHKHIQPKEILRLDVRIGLLEVPASTSLRALTLGEQDEAYRRFLGHRIVSVQLPKLKNIKSSTSFSRVDFTDHGNC